MKIEDIFILLLPIIGIGFCGFIITFCLAMHDDKYEKLFENYALIFLCSVTILGASILISLPILHFIEGSP